jgi:FSR family fosmidomycin resistance protein-like MFS transporter
MPAWLLPLLLGLAHGFSDASAGFLLGCAALGDYQNAALLVLAYNLIAFGAMPLAGLLSDHFRRPKTITISGLVATLGGISLAGASLPLAVILAGIGSALFHAGGGSLAITSSPGKASGPGLFAAFGVLGLALGSQQGVLAGSAQWPYLFGLLAVALAIAFQPHAPAPEAKGPTALPKYEFLAVLLILAIALRSTVWTSSQYALLGLREQALMVSAAAMLGKLLGGFFADKTGWRWYLPGVVAVSIPFITLGQNSFALLLVGVFLMQSSTPASIALLGQVLPKRPGLAASLTLGTALILGGLPSMAGFSAQILSPLATLMILSISAALYWFTTRQAAG